jgi:hypothetical protein
MLVVARDETRLGAAVGHNIAAGISGKREGGGLKRGSRVGRLGSVNPNNPNNPNKDQFVPTSMLKRKVLVGK